MLVKGAAGVNQLKLCDISTLQIFWIYNGYSKNFQFEIHFISLLTTVVQHLNNLAHRGIVACLNDVNGDKRIAEPVFTSDRLNYLNIWQ